MKFKPAIFSAIILCSCTFNVETTETTSFNSSTKSGNSIDSNLRAEIQSKNELILSAIYKDTPKEIYPLLSDLFKETDLDKFDATIHTMHETMDSTDYVVFAQYYTKASAPAMQTVISSQSGATKDTNDYKLIYTSASDESYLSMLVYRMQTTEFMLSTLYGKYNGAWQLDLLNISVFTSYYGTAPQYYYASKELFEKEQLLSAYSLMLLSQLSSRPSGDIFKFELDEAMQHYYEDVTTKVDQTYKLPLLLNNVQTKPEIIRFSISATADYAYLPLVAYKTNIPLTNLEQLEKESNLIFEELDRVLPGFTQGFSHVFLKAYNEIPQENMQVPAFTFLKPLTPQQN